MAGATNTVIAELTRYASLIAGIVRDYRKPGAEVRRPVFVATIKQIESDLDDLRRTANLGDAGHAIMETASSLNHAQAKPESMPTFLRNAQVSIATAIKQYRRQHTAGQSLKSTAIKTNQRVTLPDGTQGVVTGVALGDNGEPLVRVRAVKAINWRSTLQALVPLVASAIASAQRGVFMAKEERILKSASGMLKRAAAGVGAGIPKEAANFARTAQQAADSALFYGKKANPADPNSFKVYAHQAGAVMTYLKEAINAIPATTRSVTKSADVIVLAASEVRAVKARPYDDAKRALAGGKSASTKTPSTRVGSVVVKNELGFMPHPDTSGDWFFNIDGVENRIYGRYAEALRKAVMIAKRDLLTEITVTGVRRDYGQ